MKRRDDFILQNVAGEWLLLPIGEQVMDLNGIITLNETSAHLWDLLAEERDAGELAASLSEHFEVDATTATADVQTFLEEISRLRLIEG